MGRHPVSSFVTAHVAWRSPRYAGCVSPDLAIGAAVKVAAHPLVVAAALGLLGPEALEGFSDPEDGERASAAPRLQAEKEDALGLGLIDETLFTVDAPSPEDVARVADAWKKLG